MKNNENCIKSFQKCFHNNTIKYDKYEINDV